MTNVGHNEKLPRFRGFICLPKMRFCVHNASFSMTLVDLPPFPFGLCCAPCVVWGSFPVVVFSPCAAVWLASAFPTSSAFRTSFVSGSVVCSSSQSRRSRWSRLQEPRRKKELNFRFCFFLSISAVLFCFVRVLLSFGQLFSKLTALRAAGCFRYSVNTDKQFVCFWVNFLYLVAGNPIVFVGVKNELSSLISVLFRVWLSYVIPNLTFVLKIFESISFFFLFSSETSKNGGMVLVEHFLGHFILLHLSSKDELQ